MSLNKELVQYVEENIIPRYQSLDQGHNGMHIYYVIKRSLMLAKEYNLNYNMVYVIAAFHDLGMIEDRERHEFISADLLKSDPYIKSFFSKEELDIMCQAIQEHRASFKGDYSNIYSRVVSQADRNFDVVKIISRTIQFGLKFYPQYSFEEQYARSKKYIIEKYGENGYVRVALPFEEDRKKLKKIREIISCDDLFYNYFLQCYRKEITGNED